MATIQNILSTKFIEGVKGIYKNLKISLKLEGNWVLDEFDSNIGLRQGCYYHLHYSTKSMTFWID
jgi:hypothetical protein